MKRAFIAVAGMAVLLGANYFLRRTLEESDIYIYSFFGHFFSAVEAQLFGSTSVWWKLLLPLPELAGGWLTTSGILTHLIELRLTPPVTWYVFNAALMVVSFLTSWVVFRSLAFSFTLVICMGFGTQLYATYGVPGAMGLYLLLIYYEVVLLCALRVIQGAAPNIAWRIGFAIALVITALAYESWLDFAVFMWLAAALTAAVAYRFDRREWWPGLAFTCGWLVLICVSYVYIKVNFGYGQIPGAESDVIFNYPAVAPMVEDVISNTLTQFYIVITNFLPPSLVSSTAFYSLGGNRIVELQQGYAVSFAYLVVMQYMFLWRFYAGAAFVIFVYIGVRTIRQTLREWSPQVFAAAIFLTMVATGGPTHALVKARPMNSMPVLGYHVVVGVLGMALLISLIAKMIDDRPDRRWLRNAAVAAIWAVILWGALARPGMLRHQAAQVGLGENLYPDPKAKLAALLGWPIDPPAGFEGYHLMKRGPAPLPTAAVEPAPAAAAPILTFGPARDPLPTAAPALGAWTLAAGVTATALEQGFKVTGNEAIGGYQMSSPLIPVPANHRVMIRMQGTMEQGYACLGVLNRAERWLLAPTVGRSEVVFDTGEADAMMLVLINCGKGVGRDGQVAFTVESLSYAVLMNPAQ